MDKELEEGLSKHMIFTRKNNTTSWLCHRRTRVNGGAGGGVTSVYMAILLNMVAYTPNKEMGMPLLHQTGLSRNEAAAECLAVRATYSGSNGITIWRRLPGVLRCYEGGEIQTK